MVGRNRRRLKVGLAAPLQHRQESAGGADGGLAGSQGRSRLRVRDVWQSAEKSSVSRTVSSPKWVSTYRVVQQQREYR